MMEKRDLKADLELCNKATPGPWVICDWDTDVCGGIITPDTQEVVIEAEDWGMPVKVKREDADFIVQAREGWPHAIERALELEEELTRCGNTLVELTIALKDDRKRADKTETIIRELLDAVDIACRLASDYRMEAEYGVAVKREYTKREQYKLIDDIVYRAKEVLGDE